jgi:hypothetical protein
LDGLEGMREFITSIPASAKKLTRYYHYACYRELRSSRNLAMHIAKSLCKEFSRNHFPKREFVWTNIVNVLVLKNSENCPATFVSADFVPAVSSVGSGIYSPEFIACEHETRQSQIGVVGSCVFTW